MREIKKYICDVCNRQYDTKEECEYCEKVHIREEEFKKSSFPEFEVGDIVEYTDEDGETRKAMVTQAFVRGENIQKDGSDGDWHWMYTILFDEGAWCQNVRSVKGSMKLIMKAGRAKMEYEKIREHFMLQYGIEVNEFIRFIEEAQIQSTLTEDED